MTDSQITCPVCSERDRIQKVSSIVSVQTREVEGVTSRWDSEDGWYDVPVTGTERSELAKKLTPPVEPEKEGAGCLARGMYLFWLPGFIFLGVLGFYSLANSPDEKLLPLLWLSSSFIYTIFLPIRHFINERKSKLKYAREKPAWDLAMRKWERLYYCYRDDLVFDPQSGATCPPKALMEFIYIPE